MSINRLIGNAEFNPEKADFIFADIVDEPELIKLVNQQYTDLRKVDYFVDEDCKLPMSFTQIKTVEQGIEWYSYYHPEINDDIIPMLARHQFGNLPKKHTRHSKNKKRVKNSGISISREITTLNFED